MEIDDTRAEAVAACHHVVGPTSPAALATVVGVLAEVPVMLSVATLRKTGR